MTKDDIEDLRGFLKDIGSIRSMNTLHEIDELCDLALKGLQPEDIALTKTKHGLDRAACEPPPKVKAILDPSVYDETDQHLQTVPPEAETHPWDAFLAARANAIDWMHEEGDDDQKIARVLSMDERQVMLIRTRVRPI